MSIMEVFMSDSIRIVTAPLNTQVKNIAGNIALIKNAFLKAEQEDQADLVVTPELSITGYPLRDAVENPDVLDAAERGLNDLVEFSKGHEASLVVGLPFRRDGKIFNCSVVIQDGKIITRVEKRHRPNYGVFDEIRNFESGLYNSPFMLKGVKIGLLICEDTWQEDVAKSLKEQDAEVLVSTNASPYETGKYRIRENDVVAKRVEETGLPMVYVNQVGGQDELYFDGGAFAIEPHSEGQSLYRVATRFSEEGGRIDFSRDEDGRMAIDQQSYPLDKRKKSDTYAVDLHDDYTAIILAVRDYANKTGMKQVCLGMSGGVDSALVAAIAVDALGAENVKLYSMPSIYTSDESNSLAYDEANRLGCSIESMPIQGIVNEFQKAISPMVANDIKRITIENFQARTRGTLLMGIANNNPGMMVLSTGNKSENAVGYATLYGDMNGGYNPLKDVLKTRVFELCEWRNKAKPATAYGPEGEVIPMGIITRPPSAELFEDQKDSDSLPPYEILDDLIARYAEDEQKLECIARDMKQSLDFVKEWTRKIDLAEYKRAQSCPGPKIRRRDFRSDRRYPIAASSTATLSGF